MAISIPIFTSQLEKSRDAVTLSNIRAAYAEAQSAYLTGSSEGTDVVYTAAENGEGATVVVNGVEAKGQKAGLDNTENLPIPAGSQTDLKTAMGGNAGTYKLTFTYDADGLKSVSAEKTSK